MHMPHGGAETPLRPATAATGGRAPLSPDLRSGQKCPRSPLPHLHALMFDPNLPQENTPLDAAEMRSQLTGLKTLIDACASGADLANAVQNTSANSNGVSTLTIGIEPDYNPLQVQLIADKLDELITALRR
jgi:hypothetical protein